MYTITVSQKGQVVLPAGLRKKHNIKKGTKLMVKDSPEGITLVPQGVAHIYAMRGCIKADESMTDFLLRERREDDEIMERQFKRWKK
jgi:AbrB family looped-hinge helix DNA binding protein